MREGDRYVAAAAARCAGVPTGRTECPDGQRCPADVNRRGTRAGDRRRWRPRGGVAAFRAVQRHRGHRTVRPPRP